MSDFFTKVCMWVMWALLAAWVIFMLWMFGMWLRDALSIIAKNFWGLVGLAGIIGAMGLVKIGWYKYQSRRRADAWRRRKP